jgi:hypothetical protein
MRDRKFVKQASVLIAVLLGLLALLSWGLPPDDVAGPCAVAHGPAALPDIAETSGLAISRRDPALLWSHNDSGHATVLFALDNAGALRGRVRVPIRTRDWEDVSAGRCPSGPCLYIADIGDNRSARPQIRIYRVPEPSPGDAATAPPELFEASYADGPHNAEAMFVIGQDLFIVTRDLVGSLYRTTLTGNGALTFQRIGQLGLAPVTDAEASSDEKSVVVRTYYEAVFYRTSDLTLGKSVPYLRIPLDGLREGQGEGVAFDGSMLYLSSEGTRTGRFLALRCSVALSM